MFDSPLSKVVRDKRINQILEDIRSAVREHRPFTIPPKDVDLIRRRFSKGLLLGERKLHELAGILLEKFAPGRPFSIRLILWCRCPNEAHAEVLTREVELGHGGVLKSLPDMLLGRSAIPSCPLCGTRTQTVASFVRREPQYQAEAVLRFVQTRIKTTSNICYKIADMVFDIDVMFQRDKIYNEFSQIVSDIYGVKLVLSSLENMQTVLQGIRTLQNSEVIEEKDYTGIHRKKSGFEAYKVVLKRDDQLFEVQLQTWNMFNFEQHNPSANHQTYKEWQMADRRKLGKEYVNLYQALAKLFTSPEQNYCSIEYIEIGQSRKGLDDEF